jgi:hypothetical protein
MPQPLRQGQYTSQELAVNDLSIFELNTVLVERLVGDLGKLAAGIAPQIMETLGNNDDTYTMEKEWELYLCRDLPVTDFGGMGPVFTQCRLNVDVAWLGDKAVPHAVVKYDYSWKHPCGSNGYTVYAEWNSHTREWSVR